MSKASSQFACVQTITAEYAGQILSAFFTSAKLIFLSPIANFLAKVEKLSLTKRVAAHSGTADRLDNRNL